MPPDSNQPSTPDTDPVQPEFDAQAEVRLQHMITMLRSRKNLQLDHSAGIAGHWENEVFHIEATSTSSDGTLQERFAVARKTSVGRGVEAVVTTAPGASSGEQAVSFKVRRLEDGRITEYTLNPAWSENPQRSVRMWSADPDTVQEFTVPAAKFIAQTNAVLAELQAGAGRVAAAARTDTPPATT